MTTIFLVTQVILSIFITVLVLLQKTSSSGLGVYSGSNDSLFGAKGALGFITKLTMAIGFIFVLNTLALGYFYAKQSSKSIIDSTSTKPNTPNTSNKLDVNSPLVPSPISK